MTIWIVRNLSVAWLSSTIWLLRFSIRRLNTRGWPFTFLALLKTHSNNYFNSQTLTVSRQFEASKPRVKFCLNAVLEFFKANFLFYKFQKCVCGPCWAALLSGAQTWVDMHTPLSSVVSQHRWSPGQVESSTHSWRSSRSLMMSSTFVALGHSSGEVEVKTHSLSFFAEEWDSTWK